MDDDQVRFVFAGGFTDGDGQVEVLGLQGESLELDGTLGMLVAVEGADAVIDMPAALYPAMNAGLGSAGNFCFGLFWPEFFGVVLYDLFEVVLGSPDEAGLWAEGLSADVAAGSGGGAELIANVWIFPLVPFGVLYGSGFFCGLCEPCEGTAAKAKVVARCCGNATDQKDCEDPAETFLHGLVSMIDGNWRPSEMLF